ncbi:DUF6160 family protein [Marinobacter sp. HL-58]|uniref:DUF6160 family protein n=1 Tax=Marinobacter sp. HL-58 TaxID=1479237 RepID=UPI000482A097|nr:DUF6160 family protein [Marinobacter sp. HL-58]KPP97679.1 MAG: hypothetical protein HLUCCO03_10910 [Marinobacter sp. HL-58]
MKGLKRTLLALGVAGLPAAAMADIEMLDDSAMGDITGQAGVTIELETKLNIDRFIYTDEGSLEINDIFVGGTNRSDMFSELGVNLMGSTAQENDLLDNIRIEIDILSDGDALINVLPQTFGAVDMRISTGAWNLTGTSNSTTVLDNFQADMVMGGANIEIDTATDNLNFRADIAIDDMDFDMPFIALGIEDLSLTGADYDPVRNKNIPDLFAKVDLDIYKRQNSQGVDSLAIDMDEFRADITMGGVIVGGTSIGRVFMDDLAVTNTRMLVYGH